MLEFFLEPESAAATAVARKQPVFNLGNYYALVIGNQKYQKLQPLNRPRPT